MATSPDLSAYVDLTVYDKNPSDLVARFLADAMFKLPGWNPLEGNTEVMIAESLALIVAELIYAINRLPGATVETLIQIFGIVRDTGAPPTATATFTLADTLGHIIPAGTRLQTSIAAGTVTFTTDAPIVCAPGSSTCTGPITGAVSTSLVNGVAPGQPLTLFDNVYFVNSVVLATAIANGRDPETDLTWLTRAINKLGGLTSTFVLPSHFTTAALNMTADNVFRAFTIDNWDATLSGGAGGASQGHVTVAVLAASGVMLSSGQKADVLAQLTAGAMAGLAIHVIDPTITTVPVTVSVQQKSGFTVLQVQNNVTAALAGFLSTDTWQWGSTVRRNDLIALLTTVTGVAFVGSLTLPAADVALSGAAPLPTLGAVTVVVTGP